MGDQKEPHEQREKFFDKLDSDYANNVAFEATVWDLKIIFGEFSNEDKSVEWHTAMTIPWAQAKLMAHFLTVNIEAYEAENGRVQVPNSMLPPPPQPAAPNSTPLQKTIYEIIKRRWDEFMQQEQKS